MNLGYPAAVVALTAALWTAACFPLGPRADSFRVAGKVAVPPGRTVSPLQSVVLEGPGRFRSAVAKDGSFEFSHVPSGHYSLRPAVSRFISGLPPNGPGSPPAQPVVVDRRDVLNLELAVEPDWFPIPRELVSGQALAQGGPVPRFEISVDTPPANGFPRPITEQFDGKFSIVLPLGEHRITVKGFPEFYRLVSFTYGSADALAGPIDVTADRSRELQVRFAVTEPAPWVSVSGRVSGATTGALSLANPLFLDAPQTDIHADGAFVFPKVLPGIYEARFNPASGDTAPNGSSPKLPPFFWGRSVLANIDVKDRDVTTLQITVPADRQLRGRIVTEGGKPPRGVELLLSGGGSPFIQIVGGQEGDIARDGAFQKTFPEGEYTMQLLLPPGYRVERVQYGSDIFHVANEDAMHGEGKRVGGFTYRFDSTLKIGPDKELLIRVGRR